MNFLRGDPYFLALSYASYRAGSDELKEKLKGVDEILIDSQQEVKNCQKAASIVIYWLLCKQGQRYVMDVKGFFRWQFCFFPMIWVAQLMLGPSLDWTVLVGMLFTDICLFSGKEELWQPTLECVRNLYQRHPLFLK